MPPLRLARAVIFATTTLAAAVVLTSTLGGAAGCEPTFTWECADTEGADLGSDTTNNRDECPCPCCTTGPANGRTYPQGDCAWLDAGAEGGDPGDTDGGDAGQGGAAPGACTGECLPATPNGWEGPQLLFIASPMASATCPNAAPEIVYEGYGSVTTSLTCSCTFAWACQGMPSGTCPGGGDCAAFGPVSGALNCVFYDGNVVCPVGSAYSDPHVFYAGGAPASNCIDGTPTCTINAVQPSTFCCLK